MRRLRDWDQDDLAAKIALISAILMVIYVALAYGRHP